MMLGGVLATDLTGGQQVLLQVVITVGVILSAAVPAYFKFKSDIATIKKTSKEARDQTANTHSTNLRDELDDRHEKVTNTLASITDTLREAARDIRGLREDHHETRRDVGMLHAEDRTTKRELRDLREEVAERFNDLNSTIRSDILDSDGKEHKDD